MRILSVYATAHGSTAEVAAFIADAWRAHGIETDVAAVESVGSIEGYDAYALGSAVHNGLWLPDMANFVGRSLPQLALKPVYLWLNCLRVLEPDGDAYVTKHYLPNMLDRTLSCRRIGVFAGKIDRATIDEREIWMLTFRYDGSRTPAMMAGDHRDWQLIRAWADQVAADLKAMS